MNEDSLFATLRAMTGSLTQMQVDSTHAILNACTRYGVADKRQIAYVLATAFHEARLKPVIEIGLGRNHDYGKKLKMGGGPGKRIPYTVPDKLFYGRGFVQLTWYENYQQFAKILGIDLLNRPEMALQPDYAAEIIVIGMLKGLFTGVGLNKYFNDKISDPVNARKIVNGLDCSELIAGYYQQILKSIL
jgi:putative chitinase